MKPLHPTSPEEARFHADIQALASPNTQPAAFTHLVEAGAAALPAVLSGMAHADWRVRKWCVNFMDHFADERCVGALKAALRDPMADVRRHAVHAVGCQGCKKKPLDLDVVGELVAVLETDTSILVLRVAAHMLGNQAYDPRAVSALRTIIKTRKDGKLVSNAGWALRQHTSKASTRLTGRQLCRADD